jgi:hypothetical protein
MLADSHSGALHSELLADGVARKMLSATIRYAIAATTVIRVRGRTIPISNVRITDAGRQELVWPKSGTTV